MKKIFYFIIFFLTTLSTALAQIEIEEDSTIVPFYQQIDSVFAGVNLNRMETDYLLEKSLVVDDPRFELLNK